MSASKCAREECPCTSTFNGLPGFHCCRTCQAGTPCRQLFHMQPFPTGCANPRCSCPVTWNGRDGEYCCAGCRDGRPCPFPRHQKAGTVLAVPQPFALEDGEQVQYHGTSLANARAIEKDGFTVSESGLLGPGVYVCDLQKAERFAKDTQRHGGDGGCAVVKCRLEVSRVVRVEGDTATDWRKDGFEACYAPRTSLSQFPEWCVADPRKLVVVCVQEL
eukprot:TRINITY_DN42907_c0_g1_i1.p1 TRINITY_DN42907_c0_g1~~TRINITY_DN42907_c0_g1_i1.p1  ORF type:complete len:218 (+),score=53.75 TRINITY_DN42907_c0_g1_i1:71-724(+)